MALPKKLSQHVINYGLMAALALMLVFLVFGEWGLLHYQRLSEERRSLEERSQALQRENELLREKIYLISKDDRYLEKIGAGRSRPGERKARSSSCSPPGAAKGLEPRPPGTRPPKIDIISAIP